MATRTPSELLDWLVEHEFLRPVQADQVRALLPGLADNHALVKELLRRDWLTPFQANQILNGKGTDLILGDYRLLERVGHGAMGQVFKAWNLRLERVIAVKTIHRENLASPKAMERFRREMETASQLDHPNIVLVRDADQVDNRPFLVMDYVDGTDMARMVKSGGPLPVAVAADYIRQAALGLQHAFERGVVHRDVKPGNLLVARHGPGQKPVVKILDFGLARFDSDNSQQRRLTQVGNILGTIDYIAPEQAVNARTADVRSDIYSLGCSLFFILAGRPPFPGATIVEKITSRMIGAAPRIRDLRADVPPGLEAVLVKMLARSVEARYQTPQEVAKALEPFTFLTLSAIPLAQPVLPVPAAMTAPSATPIVPAPILANQDPFSFSTEESLPTIADAVAPARAPFKRSVPDRRPWLIWGGAGVGGVLVLVLIVVLITRLGGPGKAAKKMYGPEAALVVKKPSPIVLKTGQRKPIVARIQRTKFSGPVKVFLDGLPEGVQATFVIIPETSEEGELHVTVSFLTPSLKKDVRVVAEAENLRDETTVGITVQGTGPAPKQGGKKWNDPMPMDID